MPRIKPVAEYPEEYFEAFENALKQDEFIIPCDDHNEAKLLRSHLYTFRSAVRGSKGFEELAEHIDDVQLQIDGTKLILRRKEEYGADIIREALNEES